MRWLDASKDGGTGESSIDAARRGVQCSVCSQRHGYTLSCLGNACTRKFHVLCAMRTGDFHFMRDERGVRAYCPTHRPKPRK